jgi:hypothetical protein
MLYQIWLSINAMWMKRVVGLLVLSLMLMLQACNSGGSGDSGDLSTTDVPTTVTLTCDTTSGWNDVTNTPATPYSFADFEQVVASCGQPMKVNYTYFAGKIFHIGGETSSVFTFDSTSTIPTISAPATGTYVDTSDGTNIVFTWYVEDVSATSSLDAYSYLVIQGTDSSTGDEVRLTQAFINVTGTPGTDGVSYSVKTYYEDSNYSSEYPMVREQGTDGAISSDVVIQDSSDGTAAITCPTPGSSYSFDGYAFDDYETGLALCSDAKAFDYTWFADRTFSMPSGNTYAFDAPSSAPSAASPATGTYTYDNGNSVANITWYVEDAGGHNYLVLEGNDGVAFRDTGAIVYVNGTPGADDVTYVLSVYSERQDTAAENPMVRETGADGTIHSDNLTQTAGGSSTITPLTCDTSSTYDVNGDPTSFFSFADYEKIVTACGSAVPFDYTWFAGKSVDGGGETMVFDPTGSAPTAGSPGTGTLTTDTNDVLDVTWYVEDAAAGGYSYLVTQFTCPAALCGVDTDFRDTMAIIAVTGTPGTSGATYSIKGYSEASYYSDMVRENGVDGDVWVDSYIQQ